MKQVRYGNLSADEVFGRDGLAFLHAMRMGEAPLPPIYQTMGFTLLRVEHGRALVEGMPERCFYGSIGAVHPGFTASLLDTALAATVHSTLLAGEGCMPVEIKVNMVRPSLDMIGRVEAEGAVLYRGRTVATAEGNLTDATGKLYAHATLTCTIFPLGERNQG
jgi:uncharacterized protein (TIGR00369 family)